MIVLGGASGIGAAIARALVDGGATVDVYDRAVANSPTPGITHTELDVRDTDAVTATLGTRAEADEIHGLVYAVGILDGYTALDETTEDLLRTVLDINVQGAVRALQAIVPAMKRQNYGRIVLFGSIAGSIAGAGGLSYTASKHAIAGVTRHLAHELGEFGITINTIAPGSIEGTNIKASGEQLAGGDIPSGRGLVTQRQVDPVVLYPVGRTGTVEAVVPPALLLLSADSWFMTGSTVMVDGGFTAL